MLKWFHRWRLRHLEGTQLTLIGELEDMARGRKSMSFRWTERELENLNELLNVTRAKAGVCAHDWKGEGDSPASWYCACGTKVYRSYEAYCND